MRKVRAVQGSATAPAQLQPHGKSIAAASSEPDDLDLAFHAITNLSEKLTSVRATRLACNQQLEALETQQVEKDGKIAELEAIIQTMETQLAAKDARLTQLEVLIAERAEADARRKEKHQEFEQRLEEERLAWMRKHAALADSALAAAERPGARHVLANATTKLPSSGVPVSQSDGSAPPSKRAQPPTSGMVKLARSKAPQDTGAPDVAIGEHRTPRASNTGAVQSQAPLAGPRSASTPAASATLLSARSEARSDPQSGTPRASRFSAPPRPRAAPEVALPSARAPRQREEISGETSGPRHRQREETSPPPTPGEHAGTPRRNEPPILTGRAPRAVPTQANGMPPPPPSRSDSGASTGRGSTPAVASSTSLGSGGSSKPLAQLSRSK